MKHVFQTDDGHYGAAWHVGNTFRVVVATTHTFSTRLEAEVWFAERIGGPIAWGGRDAREWARTHVRAGRFEAMEG